MRGIGKGNWIAIGFLAAFAASIFTIIYTGLNVQGSSRAEFDAGDRFVIIAPGEQRTIDFEFDSPAAHPEATLKITLPPMLDLVEGESVQSQVSLVPGGNTFPIVVEGRENGEGYLVGRVQADGQPVGLYRVFVTVADE
jgi:hypothetical protein